MVGRGRFVVAGLLTMALVATLLASVTGSRIEAHAATNAVSPPWNPGGTLGIPFYYDYSNNQPGEYGIDVPLLAGFLLTGVLYLGMAVPSSPGYVGVFDYLMVVTLGLYGEPRAASLAAAFAAHVINFVPVTLVGLAYLGRHGYVKTLRFVPGEERVTER